MGGGVMGIHACFPPFHRDPRFRPCQFSPLSIPHWSDHWLDSIPLFRMIVEDSGGFRKIPINSERFQRIPKNSERFQEIWQIFKIF